MQGSLNFSNLSLYLMINVLFLSGPALQEVCYFRRSGVAGGLALQVVRNCRQSGIAGSPALQAVSEYPRRR